MKENEKQKIRDEIKILEEMIKNDEKKEIIQMQRKKLDKKLQKYLKDL